MNKILRNAIAAAAILIAGGAPARAAAPEVNLTPVPAQITVGDGQGLTLAKGFTVGGAGLDADMATELDKFVEAINLSTGLDAEVTSSARATITVAQSSDKILGTEGYTLKVTPQGVTITAPTPAGLYFAFQSVKKLLPANVMAGVNDPKVTDYTLPEVDITDYPTFSHRGFELDCARHYHSLDQVKRMIDIMSYYKMNRFHWHLTDDQGWRVEIEKYPRLLSVSTIAPDAYMCDFATRSSYLLGAPYGPYYYTKDQMREIVAYAAERHIEVFPEIDMPGHMVAAIAAYPEFSCTPDGAHTIWYRPGVSSDVLNVSSPAVLQFCKDVVTELAEVFPAKLFHIGGDETPTSAWERSAECQQFMKEHGMTSPRELQSWFMHQMADHLKSLGKQAVAWNEIVTAGGADLNLAKEAGFLIYDWLGGGTSKAAELGLNSIYCNTSRYYLDYPQGNNNEPRSMGGIVTLPTTYAAYPDMSSPGTCIGVQGNLWTEYISDPRHLEYNALPRLIAIAETGWSPREKKNFDDFQRRITADTTLWNYGGYAYGRHYLLEPAKPIDGVVMPDPEHWVTVVTRATTRGRADRVLELVAEGSPLIASHGAKAGILWSGAPQEGSDWQQWRFIPDPSDPDRVALVCKARPEGSVNPDPGSTSTDARWKYDETTRHYNFILGEGSYYGQTPQGYFYSIRSDRDGGFWLNCGTEGGSESLTVNCWHTPDDGDGGLWLVVDPQAASSRIVMPDPAHWVTVTTRATTRGRADRRLELVADDSPLISSHGAKAGILWSGAPQEGSDWQQWRFIPDPSDPDRVALVCKARPEGSVNPDPGSTSVDARWKYDDNSRHYDFILGEGNYYGKAGDGYYYSIRSDRNAGFWLNCGTEGGTESLTVNCWHTPDDGDGGLWLISDPLGFDVPEVTYPAFEPLKEGAYYAFVNAAERFDGAMLAIVDGALALDASPLANVAWQVTSSSMTPNNVNTVTLTNAAGGVLGALGAANPVDNSAGFFNNYNGFAISLSGAPAPVVITRNAPGSSEFTMTIENKGLTANATLVAAGGPKDIQTAVAGGAWTPVEVTPYTVDCIDTGDLTLATATCVLPTDRKITSADLPAIPGYEPQLLVATGTKVTATYRLTAHKVTYECRTPEGILIAAVDRFVPVGEAYTVDLPELPYFTPVSSTPARGSAMTLTGPATVTATYSTAAHLGASGYEKKYLDASDLKDGMKVLIRDAHTGGRAAYRMAGASVVEGGNPDILSPAFIWTLKAEADGRFSVYNDATGMYIAAPVRGASIPMSADPVPYTFTLNEGGNDWRVTNGALAWDGGEDLTMHGWDAPGHPYWILAPVAEPYFKITIEEYDADSESLISSSTRYVRAGSSFLWLPRSIEGKPGMAVTGGDSLEKIEADKNIRAIYSADPAGIETVTVPEGTPRKGVYDLMGRRLPDTLPSQPGIYIINGRKVLVK